MRDKTLIFGTQRVTQWVLLCALALILAFASTSCYLDTDFVDLDEGQVPVVEEIDETDGDGNGTGTDGSGDETGGEENGGNNVISVPPPSDFYGTYRRTEGNKDLVPYTITISADNFLFIDFKGDWINHDNITWTVAANAATSTALNGYTYQGTLSNPSAAYPTGYTITGTRTVKEWPDINMPEGIFIALSADKKTLYVASSASNYNTAGFSPYNMKDSVFTRM